MSRYSYNPDPDIPSPTEIFVPALLYPQGFDVAVSGNLQWELSGDKILVKADDAKMATVQIFPL